MDEFNLNNDTEIGTSVSKLQKNNDNELIALIKDLEDRLDSLEETKTIDTIQVSSESKKKINNIKKIKNNPIKISELIIYMIIFVLLNNPFIVTIIHKFPYFNTLKNPYPNLILRTILFGSIIYLYKRYIK
jgi:hypothetical protein